MKKVIVTGAGRGIGLQLVQVFADEGYEVLALSRNITAVEELNHKNISCFSFDLADSGSYVKLSDFIKGCWKGNVDILINNAGLLVNKPFADLTEGDFLKVYQANVFGVAKTVQTVVPFMDVSGHVVTISSMGGIQGSMKFPGLAAYSSSKGAVITLSELLAEEYKGKGPAFNVLALGAVQTEMLEEAFPGYEAPLSALEMALYIKQFALNNSKYFNGKVIQVSSTTP